jgi:hypothetical protein
MTSAKVMVAGSWWNVHGQFQRTGEHTSAPFGIAAVEVPFQREMAGGPGPRVFAVPRSC